MQERERERETLSPAAPSLHAVTCSELRSEGGVGKAAQPKPPTAAEMKGEGETTEHLPPTISPQQITSGMAGHAGQTRPGQARPRPLIQQDLLRLTSSTLQ